MSSAPGAMPGCKAMVDTGKITALVREAAGFFADRKAAGQITVKGDCDFVTAVDRAVEGFLREKLTALYPEIQFLSEEQDNSRVDMNSLSWVLDPVDGTTNLMYDSHCSAISLALLDGGEPVLGIIYDPYARELYLAEKGKGSWRNGEKIRVSGQKDLKKSLIAIGTSPYHKADFPEEFDRFRRIFENCLDIRRSGSAALDLAHAACGRLEGFVERRLKIWDYAAGTLLVREAGGVVKDYLGNDRAMTLTGDVAAGSPAVVAALVKDYLND